MADIINLRRVRKAVRRTRHETEAAENRVRFGRTGEERRRSDAEVEMASRRVEGHRLDLPRPSGSGEDGGA